MAIRNALLRGTDSSTPLRSAQNDGGTDSSSSAQNDLVFIVILSDRRESKDLRLIDGDSSSGKALLRMTDGLDS